MPDRFRSISGRGVSEPDELGIMCRPPFPNVLLLGSVDGIALVIARVWSSLQRPIAYWDHGVPATIQGLGRGTLVIWAVERLPPAEQDGLGAFIGDRGQAVQVISATVDPFEQVRRGTFRKGFIIVSTSSASIPRAANRQSSVDASMSPQRSTSDTSALARTEINARDAEPGRLHALCGCTRTARSAPFARRRPRRRCVSCWRSVARVNCRWSRSVRPSTARTVTFSSTHSRCASAKQRVWLRRLSIDEPFFVEDGLHLRNARELCPQILAPLPCVFSEEINVVAQAIVFGFEPVELRAGRRPKALRGRGSHAFAPWCLSLAPASRLYGHSCATALERLLRSSFLRLCRTFEVQVRFQGD